jgi:hypothetical protein
MTQKNPQVGLVFFSVFILALWQPVNARLTALQATPTVEPLTQTTFTYQANGNVASVATRWVDGKNHRFKGIQQFIHQILYSRTQPQSPCRTRLPKALQTDEPYLLCISRNTA